MSFLRERRRKKKSKQKREIEVTFFLTLRVKHCLLGIAKFDLEYLLYCKSRLVTPYIERTEDIYFEANTIDSTGSFI